MLRSNLATRPFYNDRAVRVGIALAVLLVGVLTAFNVWQVAELNARNAEMTLRAEDAERQSSEFRREAQSIRQALNSAEMTAIQQAAQEANLLIERRVFSWTELFNEFERTLPPDVRIAAVEPQFDVSGRMLVAITVLSRRPEDLSEFMDQLESSGRFRDVLSRQDQPEGEEGLTRSVLQGYYDPKGRPPTGAASSSSESGAPDRSEPPAGTASGGVR
jgi:HPt (histidine-containing phosphotransfer) domain-containing protein